MPSSQWKEQQTTWLVSILPRPTIIKQMAIKTLNIDPWVSLPKSHMTRSKTLKIMEMAGGSRMHHPNFKYYSLPSTTKKETRPRSTSNSYLWRRRPPHQIQWAFIIQTTLLAQMDPSSVIHTKHRTAILMFITWMPNLETLEDKTTISHLSNNTRRNHKWHHRAWHSHPTIKQWVRVSPLPRTPKQGPLVRSREPPSKMWNCEDG